MHLSSLSVKQDLPWKVEKNEVIERRFCVVSACAVTGLTAERTGVACAWGDSAVNGKFYEPLKLIALVAEDQQIYACGEYRKQQDQNYQDDLREEVAF